MTDASQSESIRMRFTLHNVGSTTITAAPRLEYRVQGTTTYTVVPKRS